MSDVRQRVNPRFANAQETVAKAPAAAPRRMRKRAVNVFTGEVDGPSRKMSADEVRAQRAYESNAVPDPFQQAYTTSFNAAGPENILPPPYNPHTLMKFPNENNTLRQCIDAMVVNVESMGYRLEFIGEEGSEDSDQALAEEARIQALLDQPNGEYGVIELRSRVRRDYETLGYAFYEICRRTFTPEIVSYYHVPAHLVRVTTADAQYTEVSMWLMRNGKFVQEKIKKRFRRFVQEIGTKKVYFKEFGDPRHISSKDGRVMEGPDATEEATELYMVSQYTPGSAYGSPRWINQLPAIMGSRESELTNLRFFKDNAIPAMAILVSGGALTQESIDEIEDMIYSVQGRDSVHRVMVLEAEGSEKAASVDGKLPAPKLEIKPLTNERQSDALFQEYDKNNMTKIRSSFRIPPIFIGKSEDMTYATAQASLVMAEGQVFGPERNKVDDFFNFVVLSDKQGRPPLHWRLRSNPPRISDPATVVEALEVFEKVGALTPNVAIGIANEMFDLDIQTVDEPWGDYPFSLVTALASTGELKGLEAIREKLEPVDDEALDGTGLDDGQKDKVKDKVIDPLKKLVAVADVQRMRGKKGRTRKRSRK